jgi:hypothetical protein
VRWFVDGAVAFNMENVVRVYFRYREYKPCIFAETTAGREVFVAELDVDTKGMRRSSEVDAARESAAKAYIERMVHLLEAGGK